MTGLCQQFCKEQSSEHCAALIITGLCPMVGHWSVKKSVASHKT